MKKAPTKYDSERIEQAVIEYQSGKNRQDNFSLIYNHFYSMIFRMLRMRFTHEECEDLTQEILIKVFKNISQFRRESRLSAWVAQIAKNYSTDYLRKKIANRSYGLHISLDSGRDGDEDPLDVPDPSLRGQPEEAARVAEYERILSEAALTLSPQRRRCWQLSHEHGLSIKEIAREMGDVPEGTVKALLDQARKKIREYIISKLRAPDNTPKNGKKPGE